MCDSDPPQATSTINAEPGAASPSAAAVKRVATNAAAGGLLAVYLWQIFYTMPQLAVLSSDSAAYLHLSPFRTVGIYYFSRAVFALWSDLYAIAVAQGALLGAASLLLFHALHRTTGSSLLALSALTVCLFKTGLIIDTQSVGSDSLFEAACLALLASSILLWKRPSPTHIGLFVFFGFAASIIRPIGPAIMWSLVFVLALRLWRHSRRTLGIIAAGCIGAHVANAAIQFIHYGVFGAATLGYVLFGGAEFIADENASPEVPYAREFAASTAAYRNEYEAAASWQQKYAVMERYGNEIIWHMAFPKLLARFGKGQNLGDAIITINRVLEDISFAAIRHNPVGYARMTLVKVVAGTSMFFGYGDFDLQREFTSAVADRRVDFARDFPDPLYWPRIGDDEKTRRATYIRGWQSTPLDLKHDVARPLREVVGLLSTDPIDRLFIVETAVVAVVVIGMAIRRRHVADRVVFLLLFVAPPWGNLLAVSMTNIPELRYMEAMSPFASVALLAGIWIAATSAAERWPRLRWTNTGRPASRP